MREPTAGVPGTSGVRRKADEDSSGQGDVESWQVGARRIQHARDLEAATWRNRGRRRRECAVSRFNRIVPREKQEHRVGA